MKYRLSTLFLILILFATASANRAWACGSGADKCGTEQTEKSCCADDDNAQNAHCGENADACSQAHPGQSCPDDGGCGGGCHCPGCGTTCPAPAAVAPVDAAISCHFLHSASVQHQAFYFAQHLPEAVYLPIWQPPQLRA